MSFEEVDKLRGLMQAIHESAYRASVDYGMQTVWQEPTLRLYAG